MAECSVSRCRLYDGKTHEERVGTVTWQKFVSAQCSLSVGIVGGGVYAHRQLKAMVRFCFVLFFLFFG